jgi:hypothetical protein
VTLTEVLALAGRAWSRLCLYPGGMVLVLLGWHWWRSTAKPEPWWLVVFPWLGVALLPLPGAAQLERNADLIVVFGLCEMGLVGTVLQASNHPDRTERLGGARRLAATLNGYPLLALGAVLLGLATTTLRMDRWLAPEDPWRMALYLAGSLALSLALPALLGLGVFAAKEPIWPTNALRARVLGLLGIASVPWINWLGEWPWLQPLPPLLIAGWLYGFHRLSRGSARWWATAALLIAALGMAGAVLSVGLR